MARFTVTLKEQGIKAKPYTPAEPYKPIHRAPTRIYQMGINANFDATERFYERCDRIYA